MHTAWPCGGGIHQGISTVGTGIGWGMGMRVRVLDGRFPRPGAIAPNARRTLLAGTAFTGAFIAAIAANPQSALAACAGENTASVTCDSTNQASAGTLTTTFAGSTVVN